MGVEIRDDRFHQILKADPAVEQLASGFQFTEGPVWHPADGHLTFSDIPGNTMYRWHEGSDVQRFRHPSNKTNGNTYDRQGRLISCEHATSRVTRTAEDGSVTVLVSHHDDRELNSPNDVVVANDGAIYFTDPNYGRREYYGIVREQDLPFQGVYRLAPDGSELRLLVDDFDQPNGLCFAPDEQKLYVNDTVRKHIRRFKLLANGSLANGDVFAAVTGDGEGSPDGMKTDVAGNIYCTGPGGIHTFADDGTCLGVVLIPERAANFTFGGNDMRDVFVTATSSLYRFRVKIPGPTLF